MADPPPPQPPQSKGWVLDILDRIFSWLDKPWKAFALAGLAVMIAFGWGGWLSRDALVDIWKMSAGRPILKRSEVPAMLLNLRSETGADIVGLWSLNLSANAMVFEEAIGLHGKPWVFSPKRLPAVRDTPPRTLTQIMNGQVVCRIPEETGNEDLFNKRMIADNIHRLCLIPVPPAPNILVGILVLAWIKGPDASSEEAALGLARETASTMVSRWE